MSKRIRSFYLYSGIFCLSVWKMDLMSEDECLSRGEEFLTCGFAFSRVVVCKNTQSNVANI